MGAGYVILIQSWCVDFGTGQFLPSRQMKRMIDVTVRYKDGLDFGNIPPNGLKLPCHSFGRAGEEAAIDQGNLITLDQRVVMN